MRELARALNCRSIGFVTERIRGALAPIVMGRRPHHLKNLKIASPCPAAWSEMTGDDKVRHCKLCSLNVYNISAMSTEEAEAVLDAAAGRRMCVRFYRRADGRVMTRDCPIGFREAREKALSHLGAAAAFLVTTLIFPLRPSRISASERWVAGGVEAPLKQVRPARTTMGKMSYDSFIELQVKGSAEVSHKR